MSLPSVYAANEQGVLGRISKNALRNNYIWAQFLLLDERKSMNT